MKGFQATSKIVKKEEYSNKEESSPQNRAGKRHIPQQKKPDLQRINNWFNIQ
jgi:hypothetical protein